MPYRINHIHLKASDPRRTAEWYVGAFEFTIVNDETRVFGDRFVRCQSADGGIAVNISGPRSGETLGPGDASAHHGLEHFGFDSTDIEADIRRLEAALLPRAPSRCKRRHRSCGVRRHARSCPALDDRGRLPLPPPLASRRLGPGLSRPR
jgi:catechol 2,3-dioxygenase-like lactoylglutathione lyase family enzyme